MPDSENTRLLIEEATFQFTLGDHEEAENILQTLLREQPDCASASHALAEVLFHAGRYEEARKAGEKALPALDDDIHLHTTLSRIHMELGDKETAEKHGARARVLGWKAQLKEDPEPPAEH